MILEMDTRRCDRIEEVSAVMEVSKSHGSVRRTRDDDVMSSGTCKRRRFDSQDHENVVDLDSQRRRGFQVNLPENVAVSGKFDHVSSTSLCSGNDSSLDLEDESRVKREIFESSNGGFRETVLSSEICFDSVEMESSSSSSSSSTSKKKEAAPESATSRRKPPPASETPLAAEIEQFFAEAEKYEQKRFAEKYNYDTVNDVPLEGRYQWVRLKP